MFILLIIFLYNLILTLSLVCDDFLLANFTLYGDREENQWFLTYYHENVSYSTSAVDIQIKNIGSANDVDVVSVLSEFLRTKFSLNIITPQHATFATSEAFSYFIDHESPQSRSYNYHDDYFLYHNALSKASKSLNFELPSNQHSLPSNQRSKARFHSSLLLLPAHLKLTSRIVIYQTLDAWTGGTTALRILANTLSEMGFPVVLCNNTNQYQHVCSKPTATDIVVTGEWCRPVLASYLKPDNYSNNASSNVSFQYQGRGLQYYLGFHHGEDRCPGWIALADSHYIHSLLGHRVLSAYYLGCPMSEIIDNSFDRLFRRYAKRQTMGSVAVDDNGENRQQIPTNDTINIDCTEIQKENLVLIDADYFDDYPPFETMNITLPSTHQYLFAKDIEPHLMPYVLQRAKVVVDLALPGPERITQEAILHGAIPIISHRWNGVSELDFPSVRRVDALNSSDIYTTITEVLENLDRGEESRRAEFLRVKPFFDHVTSLPRKLMNSAGIIFSSASLHFILTAMSLQEETLMNFQILALLYLFPLASIDVLVQDKLWYYRHHYLFIDYMKQAGYVRYDRLHPRDHEDLIALASNLDWSYQHHVSLIRFYNIGERDHIISHPWPHVKIVLESRMVISDHRPLFKLLYHLKDNTSLKRYSSGSTSGDKSMIVAGSEVSYKDLWGESDDSTLQEKLEHESMLFDVCDILQRNNVNLLNHESIDQSTVSSVKKSVLWKIFYQIFIEDLNNSKLDDMSSEYL